MRVESNEVSPLIALDFHLDCGWGIPSRAHGLTKLGRQGQQFGRLKQHNIMASGWFPVCFLFLWMSTRQMQILPIGTVQIEFISQQLQNFIPLSSETWLQQASAFLLSSQSSGPTGLHPLPSSLNFSTWVPSSELININNANFFCCFPNHTVKYAYDCYFLQLLPL